MVQQNAVSSKKSFVFGIRHLQCFLLFWALTVSFAFRINLSIGIVAMTEEPNEANIEQTLYNWSEPVKSYVLSSFFCGYFITQIPGGQLAYKYGGKYPLLITLSISAVLTILTPISARIGGWQLLCAVRFILGLLQAALFPCVGTIISKWAPVDERGILSTCCYVGNQFGNVLIMALSSPLISSAMGWPSIFYCCGAMGLLWSTAWFIWGASTPSDYKNISQKERHLIEKSLGTFQQDATNKSNLKVPYSKLLTSVPFIMIIVAQCAHSWGSNTLLTHTPAYMKNILRMDINSNALVSAIPYLACLILGLVFSIISKSLNNRISATVNRKLFTVISQWIPAVTLIAFGYVSADYVPLAVSLLTISIGVSSGYLVGWSLNVMDLSSNYVGILMGISNFIGNIMSFVAPLVVGIVVHDEKDPQQWRIVFFIASGLYFTCSSLYVLFGSAKVQPWNEPSSESPIDNKKCSESETVAKY